MKKPAERQMDVDAMMMVASAMQVFARHAVDQVIPPFGQNSDLDRDRANRWSNRIEWVKILFGLYDWRYALLPIGIRESTHPLRHRQQICLVKARQLHIFGFRVARWVVSIEDRLSIRYPRKLGRLRLRRNR
jgi:hypothetical protein